MMYKLTCGTTSMAGGGGGAVLKISSILTLPSNWTLPVTNVCCLLDIHKKGIDLGLGS